MQPRGGCAVIVEAMQIVLEMLRVTIDGEAVEHVTTAEVASREALLLSTVIPALDLGLTTAYAGADEVDRLALAKREAPIVDATGLSAVAQDRRLLSLGDHVRRVSIALAEGEQGVVAIELGDSATRLRELDAAMLP